MSPLPSSTNESPDAYRTSDIATKVTLEKSIEHGQDSTPTGVIFGVVSAAASAKPLTFADLHVDAVVVGLIGYGIGRSRENLS
jgi:hypothetical protein